MSIVYISIMSILTKYQREKEAREHDYLMLLGLMLIQGKLNNAQKTIVRYKIKNRGKRAISSKKYRDKNIEKTSKYAKEYVKNNKEKMRILKNKWKKENPDRYKEIYVKYSYRKRYGEFWHIKMAINEYKKDAIMCRSNKGANHGKEKSNEKKRSN